MHSVSLIHRTNVGCRARRAATLTILSCALVAAARAGDDTDAHAWLERMTQALATRNYDARFLHFSNGRAESMRIVHRVANGVVTERLVSLDGSGREVVRTANEVMCYLPDKRTVLVEKRTDSDPLLSTVPKYNEGLKANYELKSPLSARVMGRIARLVIVVPRDEFRYGYRLWLDHESAMPLKSELCDAQGHAVEQIVFADLKLPETIADDQLRPAISTAGFRWVRQETLPAIIQGPSGWTVVNPPQGFRLTITRVQRIAGSQAPVRHLVFSDGLASVSVFIEPRSPSIAEPAGLARVGSSYAFSMEVADHRVTAVGEVPATTVRAIANAVAPNKSVEKPLNPSPDDSENASRQSTSNQSISRKGSNSSAQPE
jgi:sigma-E factor negative regulatory protein RseB